MGRADEDAQLRAAKRGHREAATEGNREEEARWANVIGDILKRRGEYVEALRWLRIDYEISVKHLPQKQLLPTCQSLGEVYFRLCDFQEALVYQKKHLSLAEESDDLIEQQRACTQLGRTYHEMFVQSENDHDAIRSAKKYLKLSMRLARKLKDSGHSNSSKSSSNFIAELIDAYNNLGMLNMDLQNYDEAKEILLQGFRMCDEEEIPEYDDRRTRLHNNLGNVYLGLRNWAKAREHIEKDILICRRIEQPKGEAQGFINLGELHCRVQKYEDATKCYQKALEIAKSIKDEDTLVEQITNNLQVVKECAQVLEEIKLEDQKLKKLIRTASGAKDKPQERKCLLEQNKSLDSLIERCSSIGAWQRHQEYAKRKKKVATRLCDMEIISDSYLAIGESYEKLRDFNKARKWYMKSWNIYRSIGNLQGQALVKINIGEVLDSSGDWSSALEAFEEGHRIAVKANDLNVQLNALENMHYSHMIRFDNTAIARDLQQKIQNVKRSISDVEDLRNLGDHCSETETEGLDMSDTESNGCSLLDTKTISSNKENKTSELNEAIDIDLPISSLIKPGKKNLVSKKTELNAWGKRKAIPHNVIKGPSEDPKPSLELKHVNRKRGRYVISDDELDECNNITHETMEIQKSCSDNICTYSKDDCEILPARSASTEQVDPHAGTASDIPAANLPIYLDERNSFGLNSPKACKINTEFGSSTDVEDATTIKSITSESKVDGCENLKDLYQSQNNGYNIGSIDTEFVYCKVDSDLVHVNVRHCIDGDQLLTECLKVEAACLYYLQVSEEKKSKGLLPVIRKLKFHGRDLGLLESIDNLSESFHGQCSIEAIIEEWMPKRLMKMYVDCCKKRAEIPDLQLLKKLYCLEISEDEVIISNCGMQDVSISPFIDALLEHKTVALLDVSHNMLGNETMGKLQQMFTISSQKYGSLTLDFHCNRFGPTSLFQICECAVILARLEVLNLSGNRLTDACSSYLATILINCKALYSLSIEGCSITSRTIQKIADVLDEGHALSHLNIGRNSPISGTSMVNLLAKLAKLTRFSELSLSGIKLNKSTVDAICQLAASLSLSCLMLGQTGIGADEAIRITEALSRGPQELTKLDMSHCGIKAQDFTCVCTNIRTIGGIVELNLEGNSLSKVGCIALSSLLTDPLCSLRVLHLKKCQLGLSGIVEILKAVEGNNSLEELYLANNSDNAQEASLHNFPAEQEASIILCPEPTTHVNHLQLESREMPKSSDVADQCLLNPDCNMEVADSEDETMKEELTAGLETSSTSSTRRRFGVFSQMLQEMSAAISKAKGLMVLDLSENALSPEAVEMLYMAWSSRSDVMSTKHTKENMTHFSVEGRRCCGIRACCRRDWIG